MPDKKIKNPGAKGGKYYINSKGNVVYGEKPHGEHPDYDPKKDFKAQFPSFEDFQKLAQQHGLPDISMDDYKKLYQTEHKAYMKTVKESGTKGVKGFSGEKQVEFLKKTMFLNESGEYAGLTVKQVLEQAEKEGIEVSTDEAMKFYKKVKYDEKKFKEGKIKPPEPKPEPKVVNPYTDFGSEASVSLDKNVTIIHQKPDANGLTKIDGNVKYGELESKLSEFNTIVVTVPHGMADKRIKKLEEMGFETIYTHGVGTEKHETDTFVMKKKAVEPKPEKKNYDNEVSELIKNNPPLYDKYKGEMDFTPISKEDSGLDDEGYKAYTEKLESIKGKYMKAIDDNSPESMMKKIDKISDETQKVVDTIDSVETVKIPYSSTSAFPTKIAFSNNGDDIGEKLDMKEPWENINKSIYWQHSPASSKWEAGVIYGYNEQTNEYTIKATGNNGVTFHKVRPESAIRIPMQNKTFYPASYYTNKLKDAGIPAFSVEEAKKHISDYANKYGLKEMKAGVTINHDSTAFENLEVRMRYDEHSNSHVLEMKLRNPDVKNEIYDNMKKNGKMKQKIWYGKDPHGDTQTYTVSNYSLYSQIDVDGVPITLEYNGAKTANANVNGGATSVNYDSGWAIKDLVAVSIPHDKIKDAGEAYEKALKSLEAYVKPETHHKLFTKPSVEDVELVRNMNIANFLDPQWMDTQEAFVGNFNTVNKADLENKIAQHLGKDWESKIKYKQTMEGYGSYVIEGYHKELMSLGMKHLFTGFGQDDESGVDIALSVLETGGLSAVERHKRGIVNKLSSGHSDYHSGGAEYLFTRMINDSNYAKNYSGYQSNGVKIRWKPEIMDRTDVFLYTGDTYGATIPKGEQAKKLIAQDVIKPDKGGDYAGRVTAKYQAQEYLSSGNEVMFKKGVSPEFIDKVMLQKSSELSYMADKFVKKGWVGKKMSDGRLMSDIICLMKTDKPNSTVAKTLTQHLKDVGYIV